MSLTEKLAEAIKASQKNGDAERLTVLRFISAQMKNREIEKRSHGGGVSEEDALQVFQREAKKRKEAIDLYKKGGRPELAAQEAKELSIIEEFLPAQMTREEVVAVIDALRSEGLSDFNGLMKEAMNRLRGQADGRVVGDAIKEKLG